MLAAYPLTSVGVLFRFYIKHGENKIQTSASIIHHNLYSTIPVCTQLGAKLFLYFCTCALLRGEEAGGGGSKPLARASSPASVRGHVYSCHLHDSYWYRIRLCFDWWDFYGQLSKACIIYAGPIDGRDCYYACGYWIWRERSARFRKIMRGTRRASNLIRLVKHVRARSVASLLS